MDSVNIQGLTSYAGGLCGALDSGLIEGCFSSGSVSGVSFVGGLVGWLRKSSRAVNCYSSAVVNGSQWVGGLIGSNDRSFVIGCHSSYSSWDIPLHRRAFGKYLLRISIEKLHYFASAR